MSYSEAFLNLFYLNDYNKKNHNHYSDKKVIEYLEQLLPSEREQLSLPLALRHIKQCPSEKRFNIFMKYINPDKTTIKDKVYMMQFAFMSGNTQLFKRVFTLFQKESYQPFLEVMNREYASSIYKNKDLSGNCIFLKNILDPKEYSRIKLLLSAALFYQKNINSFFYWATEMKEFIRADYAKNTNLYSETWGFIYDGKMNNFRNTLFREFYDNHSHIFNLDIADTCIHLTYTKRNREIYIQFLKEKNSSDKIFDFENAESMNKMFYTIFFCHNSNTRNMNRNIDIFFSILNFCPVEKTANTLSSLEKNIKEFIRDHSYGNDKETFDYFKKQFVNFLNKKFNDFHLFFKEEIFESPDFMEKIKIISEKELLKNTIPELTDKMIFSRL